MVLNPNTICKPLNFRELDFYQNIQDQDIKMFVPKYKGKLSSFRRTYDKTVRHRLLKVHLDGFKVVRAFETRLAKLHLRNNSGLLMLKKNRYLGGDNLL